MRRTGWKLDRKVGTEGPKYDPYAYTEWTVTRNDGLRVTLHDGLVAWLAVNKLRMRDLKELAAVALFEELTGLKSRNLEAIWRNIHYRCRKCGSRDSRQERGYPGEWLNVCVRCGTIISTDSVLSEIE